MTQIAQMDNADPVYFYPVHCVSSAQFSFLLIMKCGKTYDTDTFNFVFSRSFDNKRAPFNLRDTIMIAMVMRNRNDIRFYMLGKLETYVRRVRICDNDRRFPADTE